MDYKELLEVGTSESDSDACPLRAASIGAGFCFNTSRNGRGGGHHFLRQLDYYPIKESAGHLFLFWQYWGLNSGSCTCQTGVLPLEPLL
jgi:hypothetical protein